MRRFYRALVEASVHAYHCWNLELELYTGRDIFDHLGGGWLDCDLHVGIPSHFRNSGFGAYS